MLASRLTSIMFFTPKPCLSLGSGHLGFVESLGKLTLSRLPSVKPRSSQGSGYVEALVSLPQARQRVSRREALTIPLLVKNENGASSFNLVEPGKRTSPDVQGLSTSQPLKPKIVRPSRRATVQRRAAAGPPKYSKAARRFYNEKFLEPQRLSKVLAAAGVASRRSSEEVIFTGRVTVNGSVCRVPQTLVDPLKDIIYVDGHSLPKKLSPKLYFVLNKPKGYICSSSGNESKSVLSLFEDYLKIWVQRNPGIPKPRMFTVGRLDVATSGLLLVTNDGDFAFSISHPSSGLTKEYIVTIEEKVTRRQVQTIADGTMVQGVQCVPLTVGLLDGERGEAKQRLRIVVSEGRNHEVRHLVENAGLEIHALKRVRIGGYRLPRTLGLGKHRSLAEADVKKLLDKSLQG